MNSVQPKTIRELIHAGAEAFQKAKLWFGHGSDNAFDEAAELVFFATGLRHEEAEQVYDRPVDSLKHERILQLFDRRIRERIPAAYLTHRMWFAGHEFYVDERVLVPRSPIAELIEARFEPWIDAARIQRVLDIGTGSGCIAIAAALALPQAQVDATDISDDALAVAAINIERHQVCARVRTVRSDVFDVLGSESGPFNSPSQVAEEKSGRSPLRSPPPVAGGGLGRGHPRRGPLQDRYDVIVSNPPYVGDVELASLPDEYASEPRLGLHGGTDGLDIVRRILREAPAHLTDHGILVVEVGNSEDALVDAFPQVPFTWLEFERGGGGVFVLNAKELKGIGDRG
jgi:ribosomal protein L3 glutamine methyltransferase